MIIVRPFRLVSGKSSNETDKPRAGVVANTLGLQRNRAVGFIEWLGTSPAQDSLSKKR